MLLSYHPGSPFDITNLASGWVTEDVKSSQRLAQIVTTKAWSPIVFKDGYRKKENFISSRLLVLDSDMPTYQLPEAFEDWSDTAHWIGTTRSHQKPKGGITCDRFRIIAVYERTITSRSEYEYNYSKALEKYDVDPATRDAGRLFFPCTKIISAKPDGYFEPVVPLPEDFESPEARRQAWSDAFVKAGFLPLWVRRSLREPIKIGQRNDTWFRVGCEMCRQSWGIDAAYDAIIRSATYEGQVLSAEIHKEVHQCVDSAYKKASQDRADLGKLGSQQKLEQTGT